MFIAIYGGSSVARGGVGKGKISKKDQKASQFTKSTLILQGFNPGKSIFRLDLIVKKIFRMKMYLNLAF
ncbi:MAG: hypothetical protein BGO67_11570 [Alphaproteobacteria bacterium 41-28]|nr:MAG: hypothetical protein BGO67_11570 [Alphaproteobacteria bacterium 41-28]